MSELTKELRALGFANSATSRAADRIDKLEECLLEVMDAGGMAIDVRYDYGSFSAACAKARALLGEK